MKFVLDASVALKWELPESDSHVALRLREQWLRGDLEFIAPDVYLVEVAHALTRAERRRTIFVGEAEILLARLSIIRPQFFPAQLLVRRATELSSASRASVYDSLYIALAEEQNVGMVTADEKLIAKFPHVAFVRPSEF